MHHRLAHRAPRVVPLLVLLATGAVVGVDLHAADAPVFHIAAIGSFPGNAQGMAVNNHGEVALSGLTSTTPPAMIDGDTWLAGTLTALPDLGGGSAAPQALNDQGTVIGIATVTGGAWHPAQWRGTTVTDLSAALGADASPMAISSLGVIAAWVEVPTPTTGLSVPRAATWSDGVATVLPTLTPGNAYASAHCYGINAAGTVVGDSGADAVAWTAGEPASLGDFGVANFSGATAYAINAGGVIACWACDAARQESLWLWANGAVTALPPLSSGYSPDYGIGRSLPLSINSGGDVVGQHYLASGGTAAVLWQGGQAFMLASCIATGEGAGWSSLSVATSIDDQGDIVGTGKYNGQLCAYLLTPVATSGSSASTTGSASTGSATGTGTGSASGPAGGTSAIGAVGAGDTGSAGGCGVGGSTGLLALALALRLQRGSRRRD